MSSVSPLCGCFSLSSTLQAHPVRNHTAPVLLTQISRANTELEKLELNEMGLWIGYLVSLQSRSETEERNVPLHVIL